LKPGTSFAGGLWRYSHRRERRQTPSGRACPKAQLEEGDAKWFSGVTCDSYHTVWWHLHEDLLIALGIARSEDPNQ
jgi:hypothetical protein